MQTVTNLYILSLAIADECFLIGIPFLMTTMALKFWPFGNIMCKVYPLPPIHSYPKMFKTCNNFQGVHDNDFGKSIHQFPAPDGDEC